MTKQCEWCKKEFEAKRKDALLCSKKCNAHKYRMRHAAQIAESKKIKYQSRDKQLTNFKQRQRRQAKADLRRESPEEVVVRQCEWCKKEFVQKTKRLARHCSRKCTAARSRKQYYAGNKERVCAKAKEYAEKNREAVLTRKREYHHNNRARILEKRKEAYDSKGCLSAARQSAHYKERRDRNPFLRQRYLSKRKKEYLARKEREEQAAARAAYLADPINAARIEAANLSRMTPEERDRWLDKQEQEREKQERKAKREALKKEIAAQSVTASTVKKQFGEAFDLEWAPQ